MSGFTILHLNPAYVPGFLGMLKKRSSLPSQDFSILLRIQRKKREVTHVRQQTIYKPHCIRN